jgi:hypothetical protein
MGDFNYTNSQLAQEYYKIASSTARHMDELINRGKIRDLILNSDVNIADIYSAHGNLEILAIRGVGSTTKKILEWLFELGLKGATEKWIEERLSPKPKFMGYHGAGQVRVVTVDTAGDSNPGVENARRIIEED